MQSDAERETPREQWTSTAAPAIRVLFMNADGHLCLGAAKHAAGAESIALWDLTRVTDGASLELFPAGAPGDVFCVPVQHIEGATAHRAQTDDTHINRFQLLHLIYIMPTAADA